MLASVATPHHIVHRLCELDMHIGGDMGRTGLQQGVGFEFKLPELPQGKHEVRRLLQTPDFAPHLHSKDLAEGAQLSFQIEALPDLTGHSCHIWQPPIF